MEQKVQVAIILGSVSDKPWTEKGIDLLQKLGVCFELRIGSAHRTPDHVHKMVENYEKEHDCDVFICVAGKSAHLAGVVASLTARPVIAVPGYGKETAGLDALFSVSQMPKGVSVASMTIGEHGFFNGCLFAAQILGRSNPEIAKAVDEFRASQTDQILSIDATERVSYTS
ncbi:MAG: 5-(carboxyamino)imidazole ribonucleotide mutase [Zetaproteobacteria bacterium]|nr:5-(carboxyamino)imidazole ribonucleotide mutase [Zetaproteobacteria bacterium]